MGHASFHRSRGSNAAFSADFPLDCLAQTLLTCPRVGPRLWNIVLHIHADGTAAARVSVNARALLPTCEARPIEHALAYIEAVLVDCRPEDQLAVRAQGAGLLRNFRPEDTDAACAWLRARAHEALGTRESPPPSSVEAVTVTRAVVRDEDLPDTASRNSSRS